MDKSVYTAIKRILAALLTLNAAIILVIVYLAFSNYASQRKSLIEMGYTVLRAFEASRPMIFFSGGNSHLTRMLEEMFDMDTIKNIVIYKENGEIIFSLHRQENIVKTDIHDGYRKETSSEMILYNGFHPFSGMGRGHTGHGSDKIFIAIAINKANLNSIWNYGIIALSAAFLAEIAVFFLYSRIRQVIKLYEQSAIKLKNAEKEAATGRLASILAHEIKNPLSSMSGLLSFARKKCADGRINEMIDKTLDEVKRLSDIVNDFLTYGRNMELQLSEVSIKDLVMKTAELLNHDAAAKRIKFSISGGDIICRADENKFLQVFANLILNAIDASPEGGEIKIEINEKTGETVVINNTAKIVEGGAEKFFEPFYTTKTKGSGLGLSITKRLVELHGYGIKISGTSPFTVIISFGCGRP